MHITTGGVVYALTDPRNPAVPKYIGQTICSIKRRLAQHLGKASMGSNNEVSQWIRGLRESGRIPIVYVLEHCSRDALNAREIRWIEFFRPLGLLNISEGPGGTGLHNPWTEATRAKMAPVLKNRSEIMTGVPLSEAAREKWINHPNTKAAHKKMQAVNESRRRPVLCVETGEIFESKRACAKSLGVAVFAVTCAINRCGTVHKQHFQWAVENTETKI